MKKFYLLLIAIIGLIVETKSQTMPTIGQVYDFNIGDEFHYKLSAIFTTPAAKRFKITGKYYSSSNETVYYQRLFNNYYTDYNSVPSPHLDYYFDSYTDVVFYTNLDSLFNTQYSSWPVSDTNGDSFKDTLYYSSLYCGKLIYDYTHCVFCIFEGNYYHAKYGEGLGMVFYEESTSHQPQYDNITGLVYYKKDTISCGSPDLTCMSINENIINNNLSIYPNPTKDNLTIETNSITEQRIEILNLIGQTVYTNIINRKATVNTSAFAKGVYILKLSSYKETIVRKFVKE